VGPPGTGKTYVSKAVAGEAGVPFFSISGSDFVEMFVGVGASRVRDLFETAKKNAPCLVFIDEIDAVGRRRGAGIGGGNDEREQTLNQLLVEMDGFGANEGIIILAATNRPDVLDPAILRPGRFDREITINVPDVKGREAIFKLYTRNKPIDETVSIETLAKMTPGFTPADIENMMNEAALLTARRNGTIIHMDDLEEAITRVIAGPKKKSRVMSDKERKLTAFHEAGHAVVTRAIPGADPVHQVTIMPRGRAGGFTLSLPTEDKYYMTKSDMLDEIKILLGGRIAEALVMGDISTGASNDLERATKLAHDMVTKYGMSEAIGPINYSDNDEVFLGRDFTSKLNISDELAAKIDREVRSIIDGAYADTEAILVARRAQLDAVAEALLDVETLDGDEFEAIFTGSKTLDQLKAENEALSKVRIEKEKKEAEERAKREREEEERRRREEPDALPDGGKRVAVFDKEGRPQIMELKEYLKEQKEREKALEGSEKTEEPDEPEGTEASDQPEENKEPEAPAVPHEDEILQVFEKQQEEPEDESSEGEERK
ncbi:MAG: ATP-dependent zinc metalloprotease FtsH, partial [Firmicutes bacterium]|nr:ATP-dependent zinc metalloprotease FtsH [Bacillota bacterium]